MRAAWYERTGPAKEVFKVGELDTPVANQGEVLVQLCSSGVNPADVKLRSGWLSIHKTFDRIIPNNDGAGIIVDVGEGVSHQRIGQRVWVHTSKEHTNGTAAEYVALPSSCAHYLPEGVTFAEGACVGVPIATAHHLVFIDGPVEGQTVFVAGGAGAVGHYAIQLAKDAGAQVITTVSGSEKKEHAIGAGADHVINYREEDVCGETMAITQGTGVDRIIEVDLGANINLDAEIIGRDGVIASYSSTSDRNPILPYYPLALKGATVHFVQAYVMNAIQLEFMLSDIQARLAAGSLVHCVGARYPLSEIVSAHEAQEENSVIGNIIVEINSLDVNSGG